MLAKFSNIINPYAAKHHFNNGSNLLSTGKLEEAKDEMLAALNLDPNLYVAQHSLAVIYFRLKKFKDAEEAICKLIGHISKSSYYNYYLKLGILFPKYCYCLLGMIYATQNKIPDAIESLLKAYELGERDELSLFVHYIKNNDYESAKRLLLNLKETDRISLNIGKIYAYLNRDDEAYIALTKFAERYPNSMEVEDGIKNFLLELKKYELVVGIYERLVIKPELDYMQIDLMSLYTKVIAHYYVLKNLNIVAGYLNKLELLLDKITLNREFLKIEVLIEGIGQCADIYVSLSRKHNAINILDITSSRLLQHEMNNSASYNAIKHRLGKLYIDVEKYYLARRVYEELLQTEPNNDVYLFFMAQACRLGGFGVTAEDCYKKAILIKPKLEYFDALIGLLGHKNSEKVLPIIKKAVDCFPNEVPCWNLLGFTLKEQGDNNGAIVAFTHAMSLDHSDVGSVKALIGCLENQQEYSKCILAYEELIKRDSASAYKYYYSLGDLYYSLKQYDNAYRAVNTAITLKEDAIDYHTIAVFLLYKYLKKYEEAKDHAEIALKLSSNDENLRYYLALTYYRLKYFDQAIKIFKQLIAGNNQISIRSELLRIYYYCCDYIISKNLNSLYIEVIDKVLILLEGYLIKIEMYQKIQIIINELKDSLQTKDNVKIFGNLAHIATMFDAVDLVKICIENLYIDVHVRNKLSYTLLHSAVLQDSIEVTKYLLLSGVHIDLLDNSNETVFHNAVYGNKIEICELLLEHLKLYYSDKISLILDQVNSKTQTALFLAIAFKYNELAIKIITAGASLFVINAEGYNAIHAAVCLGNLDLVRYFVEIKNQLNVRTVASDSLLHLAVKFKQLEIIKYLIEKKINPNLKDCNGKTAEQVANEQENQVVYNCFKNTINKQIFFQKNQNVKFARKKFRPLCFDKIVDPKFAEAVQHCNRGEYSTAQRLLQECKPSNAVYIALAFVYLEDNKPNLALNALKSVLNTAPQLNMNHINYEYEYENYAEAYFFKGYILRGIADTENSLIEVLTMSYNYFQLALSMQPQDTYYRAQKDNIENTLTDVIAGNVAELIIKKDKKLSATWIDAIKQRLLMEELFKSRILPKILINLNNITIVADCIYKYCIKEKLTNNSYQTIYLSAKNKVSLALDEAIVKYEEYEVITFNKQVQLDETSNNNNKNNITIQAPPHIIEAKFYPIFINDNLYPHKHFIAKLTQLLNAYYTQCSAIANDLAQRKDEQIDSAAQYITRISDVTAPYAGLTSTLVAKGFVTAWKMLRDIKVTEASSLFAQLAPNAAAANELFHKVAVKIAHRYQSQIAMLTPLAIEQFAVHLATKMLNYVSSDEGKYSGLTDEIFYRFFLKTVWNFYLKLKSTTVITHLGSALRKFNLNFFSTQEKLPTPSDVKLMMAIYFGMIDTTSMCGTYIETHNQNKKTEQSNKANNDFWYIEGMLMRSGIMTEKGEIYARYDSDIEKYGYRIDSAEHAQELEMQKIGQVSFELKSIADFEDNQNLILNFN